MLDCSKNLISSLDVSACTKLTRLSCIENAGHAVESLNLEKNTKLVYLDSEAKSVSIKNNPYLTYLYLTGDKTSTSFSKNLLYMGVAKNAKIKAGTTKTLNGWVVRCDWDHKRKCYYENGKTFTGWKTISGKKYYFRDCAGFEGVAAINEFVEGYYLDNNGVYDGKAKSSWHKEDGKKWYGNSSWRAKNQYLLIDYTQYEFDANGYLMK